MFFFGYLVSTLLISEVFGDPMFFGKFNYTQDEMSQLGIYKSYKDLLADLTGPRFADSTLVQNMVSVFKAQCIPPQPPPQHTQRKVFIIIEGTHNSGRNNMLRRLAQTYQGYALQNPPRCLAHLKNGFFGTKFERKAYLALCNYAMAFDVQSVWHLHPVFMSSYYYDQLSFNIAWGHRYPEDMPPRGSNIYSWPEDLLTPDLVVLLNAHRSIRSRISTTKENYHFQRKESMTNGVLGSPLECSKGSPMQGHHGMSCISPMGSPIANGPLGSGSCVGPPISSPMGMGDMGGGVMNRSPMNGPMGSPMCGMGGPSPHMSGPNSMGGPSLYMGDPSPHMAATDIEND